MTCGKGTETSDLVCPPASHPRAKGPNAACADKVLSVVSGCVGAVRLGNKISSPPAHSRYDDLYEAALLWQDDCFYGDWYLA